MGDTVSSLLFQPPPPTKLKEEKVIWLNTRRGAKVPAFYIGFKSHGGVGLSHSMTLEEVRNSKPEEGITILYSHANAEDLGSIYPWCKYLSKMLGVNLMAYDYKGYGMAFEQGPATEEDCYADIEAAFDFLRITMKVPTRNIVLYGRSLGSGPSCYLAAGKSQQKSEDPVAGVILHAPFLSVFRIVMDTGCTVYGDKFPNADLAPMINSPVLLVHGSADKIVPLYHSVRLLKALPKSCRVKPLFIEDMSHNNVHAAVRSLFITRLNEFLDEHIIPNSQHSAPAESVKVRLSGINGKSFNESDGVPISITIQQ